MKIRAIIKESKFKDIINNEAIIAFSINLLFLIYALVIRTPYNETNDDTGMAALASGAYGGNTQYLVFINIIYGYFLKIFYTFLPGFNWYSFYELFFAFFALTLMGYLLLKKIGKSWGIVIYVFLLAIFNNEFYLVLQFTRVSMLCCIVGYITFFYAIKIENRKLKILGAFFIIIGFLMRFASFKAATCFAFFVGVYQILADGTVLSFFKKEFKKFHKYLVSFICLFSFLAICYGVDYYCYYSNPEWKEYKEYTKLRAELTDYGWPDYEENREELSKLGITENDYILFKAANMSDEDVLTLEKIEKIIELKEDRNFELRQFLYDLKEIVYEYNYFFIIVAFALVGLIMGRTLLDRCIPGIIAAIFLLVLIYYDYLSRVVPRVLIPTFFMVIVCQLYCLNLNRNKMRKLTRAQIVAAILLICAVTSGNYRISHKNALENRLDASVLYEALSNKDRIYVAEFQVQGKNYRFFDAFKNFDKGYYANQVNFGGWLTRTPTLNQLKKNLGIVDVKSALAERDDVFFYTEVFEDEMKSYIEEHTEHFNISYSIFDDGGLCKIVKYVDSNKYLDTIKQQMQGGISVQREVNNRYGEYENFNIVVNSDEKIEIDKDNIGYLQIADLTHKDIKLYRLYNDEFIENPDGTYNATVIVPSADWREVEETNLEFTLYIDNGSMVKEYK